jgi:hypothetical protein
VRILLFRWTVELTHDRDFAVIFDWSDVLVTAVVAGQAAHCNPAALHRYFCCLLRIFTQRPEACQRGASPCACALLLPTPSLQLLLAHLLSTPPPHDQ